MRLWIAAALLVGLVAAGLAAVPRVIDWNSYRPDIETAAIELFGHDVQIRGPIQVQLLPRPVLTARDVTVAGKTAEAIGFELLAHRAEATLEIGPLLVGDAVLSSLRLRRPVLAIDGEGSRRLRSWPPRWRSWTAPMSTLDLRSLDITDGRIELAGDGTDRRISLSDLSLELRNDDQNGPWQVAGLFKTDDHRFTLSATLGQPDRDGASAARVSIEARNGVEETTSLRFSGRLGTFDAAEGLSGRLSLSGPDLQHGLAAISAATGYPSTFRSIAEQQPFTIEGQLDADRRGIRGDNLQIRLSEKLGKGRIDYQLHPQTRLDLQAELPTLRLADDAVLDGFLPLDLLSKLDVPPGEIDLRLREITYRDASARQARVRLNTGTDRLTVVEQAKAELPGLIDVQYRGELLAGGLGPQLRGRLTAVGDDLASSLTWLGLLRDHEERTGWRSFSLESDVDFDSVEIAFSALDMRLDSSRLQGDASLRFRGRRQLTLDVELDRPNLDLYLADLDGTIGASVLATHFETLDADIDARFERLNWQGVHIAEGTIKASADAGLLTFEEIVARTVGETAFSLAGEIDLDQMTAELGADLTSQHPIRALRHLKLDVPVTSGRLRPLSLSGELSGSLDRFAVDVEASYDDGEASVDGQGGWLDGLPWYDLALHARHPDHQALASQLGLAPLVPAGDADGPLELTGRVRLDQETPWTASGNATLGPTSFTGSLAYDAGIFDSPFSAKLSIGTPKWDSLAPFLILSGLRLAGDWSPARWLGRLPAIGLRTAWLEKANGTLSIASKGGLAGDALTMEATLGDGLLHIERLEASPWQGTLLAEATLERRRDRPFVAIAIDLDGIETAAFTDWLGIKEGIDGRLDLDVEASTVGRTPYEMMAGLAGDMHIETGPGTIEGLGMPDLRSMFTATDDDAPIDRSLVLPFQEIMAEAGLSRGILTLTDAILIPGAGSDDQSSMAIEGTVDLLLWIVDISLAVADDAPGDAADPARTYRVVGRPDRPAGYIAEGNR